MRESLFIRQANDGVSVLRPAAGSMYSKYSLLTNTVVLGTEESLRRSQCDVADLNLFDSSLLLDQPRSRSRSGMPHLPRLPPSSLVQMAPFEFSSMSHNAH